MSKELLFFSAPWCSHCVAMKPRIEEFEKKHTDVTVKHINIDEDIDIARSYKIQSIPSFILITDGEKTGKHVGEMSLADLEAFVESN